MSSAGARASERAWATWRALPRSARLCGGSAGANKGELAAPVSAGHETNLALTEPSTGLRYISLALAPPFVNKVIEALLDRRGTNAE